MSEHDSARIERRAAQRFLVHQPVCIKPRGEESECWGLIQNLSSSGILLYADINIEEGQSIDLTFAMPPEITHADIMKARCHGSVLRITPPTIGSRSGLAVHIRSYEFLNDKASGDGNTTLHEVPHEQEELSASAHVFYPAARI